MNKVVVLGRGGAGKSTFARASAQRTGLPVLELDKRFWGDGSIPMPKPRWIELQDQLAAAEQWIMDGDLGPYDAPSVRLRRADTVVLLDLPLVLCVWRAIRRGSERSDFWRWMLTWRHKSLPKLLAEVGIQAPNAKLHVLRSAAAVREFLNRA